MLGFSKKTAWFVCHRIRESFRETDPDMLGGEGKTVEMDETFVGGTSKRTSIAASANTKARAASAKRPSIL